MPLLKKQRKFSSISKLFNLFELDKLLQSEALVSSEVLIRLVGGVDNDFFINIGEEYEDFNLNYPERMWRILGRDFEIDVYDRGNNWFQIIKIRVKEVEG